MATLAIRTFAIQKPTKSVHRITELATLLGKHPKERMPQGFIAHLYCFLFDLLALLLRVAWVLYCWGILHPDPGFLLGKWH